MPSPPPSIPVRARPCTRCWPPAALLVALSLCAPRAWAEATPHALTLEDALTYARAHEPRIEAAAAELAQRKSESVIPRARWKPTLGASVQAIVASNNNNAAAWMGTNGATELPRISGTAYVQKPGDIDWKPYMNLVAAVGLQQQVFDFGRVAADAAAADARVEGQRARNVDSVLAVELDVRESFFALLASKAVLHAAQDALQRSSLHRDELRARVEQGLRPRVELERVEADVARFEVGVVQAQGGITIAQSGFAQAVGYDERLLDAAGEPPVLPPLPAFAEALRQGEAKSPTVRGLDADLATRKAETNGIERELRPALNFVAGIMGTVGGAPPAGVEHGTYGRGFVPYIPNYYAGLVLNWRFYDATVQARREASQSSQRVLGSQRERALNELSAAVSQSWVAVDVAKKSLPGLEHALRAAHANYDQAEARYRGGLGTAIDLSDAESLRTDAEIKLALGRFDIARTRARLARVLAEGH